MKLTAIAAAVAVAGIAQVTSIPINEGKPEVPHALVGVPLGGPPIPHSGPPFPPLPGSGLFHLEQTDEGPKWVQVYSTRKPSSSCMTRLRQKGDEIYHAFRKAVGLSHITHHHGVNTSDKQWKGFKSLPAGRQHLTHSTGSFPRPIGPGKMKELEASWPSPSRPPHHHNHHGCVHRVHGVSFATRLHDSLMGLSHWEAIVLGCGIGVLLRLFWVLAIATYRAIKGRREAVHEYSRITIIKECDRVSAQVPLPTYSYPVNEKVDLKEDVDEALKSSAEESK